MLIIVIQFLKVENLMQDPSFGNEFEFWVDEDSKFLNVCVWSKKDPSTPETEKPSQSQEIKLSSKLKLKEGFTDKRKKIKEECNNSVMTGFPEDILVGYMNLPLVTVIPDTTLNTQGTIYFILFVS